jgi:hypothetical protein
VNFQETLFHKSTYLRIKYPLPPYPSYHQGLYLEEYFCKYFIDNCLNKELSRYYIPVFWTNIYLKNWIHNYQNPMIQYFIDNLPKDEKYFTVCQHDDAPTENLDGFDIDVYSAGGNYSKGIPIPLICSKMPSDALIPSEKSILCSFVGSNTHAVRDTVIKHYQNESEFHIESKEWQYNIKKQDLDNFINITKKSVFTICARGYGKQSYRFSEAIQLGSIPVYVYDEEPYLPFKDEIDYNKFCVLIDSENIKNLKDVLKSKSDADIKEMSEYGKEIYNEYFTLDKVTQRILNNLEKQ